MYYFIFCIFAILLLSALIGLKRGLFKTLFGFLAVVISLTVTYVASPYVSSLIVKNTEIDEYIEQRVYEKIEADTRKSVEESLKDSGVTKNLSGLSKEETRNIMENNPDKATQVQRIDALNLPDYFKRLYIENNNDGVYDLLGVDNFYRYLARYTARLAINAIGLLATLLAARIILFLISLIIRKTMEEDPVLSGLDRFFGMVLGIAVGLVVVWIFMIIASIAFGNEFDAMIAENEILVKLNEYNLLLKVLTNGVK